MGVHRGSLAREAALVAACLAAASVALTWPLAARIGRVLPGDLADPLLNAFTLAWGADRLPHGLRGFWDAPFFFPSPDATARSEHLLGVTLFTSPVQWATGNAVLAYNLAFLGSYVLAGLGAYLLARRVWGSTPGAWVAAFAFAFAPHRVAHVSHLQVLVSGWTPLALWGLIGYARGGSRRSLAVFAAATALQALSCGYLMYFFLLPATVLAAVELWRGRARAWRLAGGLALAAGAVLAVLTPVALAYLRLRGASGLRRSLGDMRLFSASPSDYWSIPRLAAWSGVLPPGRPERELFPGAVVAVLAFGAVAAVGLDWRRRRGDAAAREAASATFAFAAILLGAVWLSFGPTVPGVYASLVAWLPGFDGLRVPARFVVIVALALSVLAAGAVARASRRVGPRTAGLLAAGLSAAIFVEGHGGPMPLAAFDPSQAARRELNAWLRAAPPGGLLELPVAGPAFEPFTLEYQFNTLIHRRPVVNGYSGTGYALQDFLAGAGTPLEDEGEVGDLLRALRGLGVRYLVLHERAYAERSGGDAARRLAAAVDRESDQLASRARFGDAVAWRLADRQTTLASTPSGPRVAPSTLRVSASPGGDQARLAADGDVGTRWTSGGPQSGGEWLRVELPGETDVAHVVLRAVRDGHTDRPRRLRVESLDAAGRVRVLREGSILPEMLRSLADGGSLAPVAIRLPPNRSRALVLRQTGHVPYWYWSVYELEIHERAGGGPALRP